MPSAVCRMIPELESSEAPTAHPVLASANEIPYRLSVVPLDCTVHVAPPSSVRTMVPKSPTAMVVFTSGVATARSRFPVGRGFCHNQPDCANAAVGAAATTPIPTNTTRPLKSTLILALPKVPRRAQENFIRTSISCPDVRFYASHSGINLSCIKVRKDAKRSSESETLHR